MIGWCIGWEQNQRQVLSRVGLVVTPEGCGDWKGVIRDGDPSPASDIAEQRLTMTPFCKTWTLQVKLHGHTQWQCYRQFVHCVRVEDP